MTISIADNDRKINLTAVADQLVFDTDFPVLDENDITVYRVRDDVATKFTLGVDFSVSLIGEAAGCRVTLTEGAEEDDKLVLLGTRTANRVTQFTSAGGLSPIMLNEELNRDEILLQELRRDVEDSFRQPPYALPGSPYDAASRKIQNLADATNDGDAVNLGQLNAKTVDIVTNATAQATAAAASASEAAASTTAATSAQSAAEAAQAAAEAVQANLDLPDIGAGDAGKSLVVNGAGDGYEVAVAGNVGASADASEADRVMVSAGANKQIKETPVKIDASGNFAGVGYVEAGQIATPATPAAGKSRFYQKADGSFYVLDEAGVEHQLVFADSADCVLPGSLDFSFDATPKTGFVFFDGSTIVGGEASFPKVAARYPWMVVAGDLVLPDMRGLALRVWANGSSNDPDRASRTARAGDGQTGDYPGTGQSDEFKSHSHGISDNTDVLAAGTGINRPRALSNNSLQSTNAGGSETRMKNIAVSVAMRLA